MIEFKLPDIGEGIAEGEIVKWIVQEGETVAEHQPIVEVMTDKATVEVPAPAPGRITRLLVQEGDTVPVGDVLFHLDQTAGSPPASQTPPAPQTESAPSPQASAGVATPQPAPNPGGAGALIEFALPDIGEGIAEGEIVKWLVSEGAVVMEHDPIVEVMTDKATVEVPAPAAGTVVRHLASEGDTVPVGHVIFHLQTAGAPVAAPAPVPVAAAAVQGAPAMAVSATSSGGVASNGRSGGKVLAVPSARRLARELGIDLMNVSGTGRNGVIRRTDVEAFTSAPTTPAPAPAVRTAAAPPASRPAAIPAGAETRRPFRGVRRKIAEAMERSAFTAVHFTVVEECDVTDLVSVRAKAKAIGADMGVKVTYMPFMMKALALGMARFPVLNGRLDEEAQEIVNPSDVNIGIATDTPNGLIVPVIDNVQAKGMMQLASELQDLATRTREGKVKPEELRGSTITITNAGNIGGTLATPIINFPDIAILGVHRLMKKPGVVEAPEGDRIEVRQYMNLSMSVDHRIADGADAARCLAYLRQLLENPGLLAL